PRAVGALSTARPLPPVQHQSPPPGDGHALDQARCPASADGRTPPRRYVTRNVPRMVAARGSHRNLYVPFRSFTVQICSDRRGTEVARLIPGPRKRKLWMV